MTTAAVLIYLCGIVIVAVRQLHRTRTADAFFAASRGLPAPILASTLLVAWIGAGSLFSGAELAYQAGLAALWLSVGGWAAVAVIWRLASRIREHGARTVPELLGASYGGAVRTLAAATIVVAFTAVAAFQFAAGGRLLAWLTGVSPAIGIVLTALVCILVAAVAGLRSVAWADTVNAVAVIAGFGAAAFALARLDAGVIRPDQLTIFGTLNPLVAVGLIVPTFALLAGDAGLYQKLMAARDTRTARRAAATWLVAIAVVDGLIVGVALLGSAALPSLSGGEASTILMRLTTGVLPPLAGALFAAAITAVIVSATTTFLLAAATCVVHDLARLETAGDGEGAIWPARYAVAGIAVAALMLLQVFPQALAAALWAFMMYGAVITPPLMAAFFVPRVTPRAALAGMAAAIAGALAVLAFAPAIPAIFPALLLSVFTMAAVSAGGHRASLDTA